MAAEPHHEAKGVPLPSGNQVAITGAFSGMALLSVCESLVLIFTRFRYYRGLYFWSMLVATIGAFLFNLGIVLHFYVSSSQQAQYGFVALTMAGYYLFIPSEFLVLYSRLHLVLVSPRILRLVFIVAAAEFFLISVPNGIFAVGAITTTIAPFRIVYPTFQRVEVCGYMAAQIILSAVYAVQVFRIWRTDYYANARRVFTHLLWINAFLILMDCANIAMAFFKNAAPLQTAWVGFLYAFKLKVEFWILTQLTKMSQQERLLRLTKEHEDQVSRERQKISAAMAFDMSQRREMS